MNIHKIYPGNAGAALAMLNAGETPMPLAPCIELANGKYCIPQHYLQYNQTVETVSSILNDIDSVDDIILFCGQDEAGLYIQAGSVGPDNYKRKGSVDERRIVYGRRWRIEDYTPTSEVIQTAFLAIKKACEHEVRELVTITDSVTGQTGTPFSTHVDLPLMAHFPEMVSYNADLLALTKIEGFLQGVRFDGREIYIGELAVRSNGNIVVDLEFGEPAEPRSRPGFESLPMTIVLRQGSEAAVIHELMNALVHISDRLVDEQFRYRGFARFSQSISPSRIAQLSVATRVQNISDDQFEQLRDQLNYETDSRRVPSIGAGALGTKNRETISREKNLGGQVPFELESKKHLVGAL